MAVPEVVEVGGETIRAARSCVQLADVDDVGNGLLVPVRPLTAVDEVLDLALVDGDGVARVLGLARAGEREPQRLRAVQISFSECKTSIPIRSREMSARCAWHATRAFTTTRF